MVASPPRLHEVFRIPAPTERAGVIGNVVLDVALGRRNAIVKRVEDRVLQPLPGQRREEPLHGVHPGRRGRGKVELPVGTALQQFLDLGRLVRGDVVEDYMHRGSGCDPLGDMVEECKEVLRAVPFDRPADDLPGGDVEGLSSLVRNRCRNPSGPKRKNQPTSGRTEVGINTTLKILDGCQPRGRGRHSGPAKAGGGGFAARSRSSWSLKPAARRPKWRRNRASDQLNPAWAALRWRPSPRKCRGAGKPGLESGGSSR